MDIQSLSIRVPTQNRCVNNCEFCVSRTHTNPYTDRINKVVHNNMDIDNIQYTQEYVDYYNRLQFARDNGCNVVVLTGTGEPIQNEKFLDFFSEVNSTLDTVRKKLYNLVHFNSFID